MKIERGQVAGLLAAILVVWLGASALFGESGLLSWKHRRAERIRVGEATMRLARETHQLELEITHLKSGEGLEAIAREQLGLVRPNEVVYRFRQSAAASTP